MTVESKQLPLNLRPENPFSLSYLVPHSGIAEAFHYLNDLRDDFIDDPTKFHVVYLYGSTGTGKTHLLKAFADEIDCLARFSSSVEYRDMEEVRDDLGQDEDDVVSEFISTFENFKSHGGILFFEAQRPPNELSENPHVLSRLLSGVVIHVDMPTEEELGPLIASLLERHNLKLSDASLQYLLRRLPVDPLSFEHIFDKINDLSLTQNKPARMGIVREALKENINQKNDELENTNRNK